MFSDSRKFGRHEKILGSRDYQTVYRRGWKFTGKFVNLFCLGRAETCRLGITVTRAIGKANERNKVKRRIREIFRNHKDLFQGDRDVVIHAKQGIVLADYHLLLEDIRNLLEAAKKRRRPSR